MVCTFFGHREISADIENDLKQVLYLLVENYGVDEFIVGNQGAFDSLVYRNLKFLKERYNHIKFYVVLAYMPINNKHFKDINYEDSIYPDILEKTPRKFAINKRNLWMIDKSDVVVVYVKRTTGGAAKFKEIAERKGKRVINIAE